MDRDKIKEMSESEVVFRFRARRIIHCVTMAIAMCIIITIGAVLVALGWETIGRITAGQ